MSKQYEKEIDGHPSIYIKNAGVRKIRLIYTIPE